MGWSRCFTCGKEFSREDNLRRHHKDKHPEVKWWSRCFTCGKEFSREDNLRRHHKDKHPEVKWESPRSPKQYPCDLCSKIFRYEANFVKHRRTHPLEEMQSIKYLK